MCKKAIIAMLYDKVPEIEEQLDNNYNDQSFDLLERTNVRV